MPREVHATTVEAELLVRGELAADRRRELVRHLLHGCQACQITISEVPVLGAEERSEYDVHEFALRHAQKWLERYAYVLKDPSRFAAQELYGEIKQTSCHAPQLTRARAEAWLGAAKSERHQDPELCIAAASTATALAEQLDPADFPMDEIEALQGAAWAEVANAHRLAGDLPAAERCFRMASAFLSSESPLLLVLETVELAATLLKDSRRYGEADLLFARTGLAYKELGLDHFAGRSQVARGLIWGGCLKDYGRASQFLIEALDSIDMERDHSLALSTYHALIRYRAADGSLEFASHLLRRARPLYDLWGGELDLLKYQWVEAEIQLGLGDLASAERGFSEVRAGFQSRELPYQAALVTLDLCLVWLQLGKTAPLKAAAEEMLATFVALKIAPEALATIRLFAEAARQEQATADLLRRLADAIDQRPVGRSAQEQS